MIILALDQSVAVTGWAVLDHRRGHPSKLLHFGFFASKAATDHAKLELFKQHVRELILDYNPVYMVWEAPTKHMGGRAGVTSRTLLLTRLDQALRDLADELDVAFDTVAANSWRSKVLGKGTGKLPREQAKLRALWYAHQLVDGVRSADTAEAICIGLWACGYGKGLIELERAA